MGCDKIVFDCVGKCRICPFPGANCKTITVRPVPGERETDEDRNYMDQDFLEELRKGM